jgi:hypothetical protein
MRNANLRLLLWSGHATVGVPYRGGMHLEKAICELTYLLPSLLPPSPPKREGSLAEFTSKFRGGFIYGESL